MLGSRNRLVHLFLSTPSARRATLFLQHKRPPCRFLSTPSARRATGGAAAACKKKTNFYPRPPRGGRPSETLSPVAMHSYFYPRPPRGGRRGRQQALKLTSYFYPRPPRGGRRTHPASSGRAGDFYPRPPRGGRPSCSSRAAGASYFYPRPPRGGRQFRDGTKILTDSISIHALREEGDWAHLRHHAPAEISIHALREEGDTPGAKKRTWNTYFYPRPPRGGRPFCSRQEPVPPHFYPRPPRGGRRKRSWTTTASW